MSLVFYTRSNIYNVALQYKRGCFLIRDVGNGLKGVKTQQGRSSWEIQMSTEGPGNLISPFHLGLLIKIVHAFQKGGIPYSFRMSFPWISQGMARRWVRRQSLAHNQVLRVASAAQLSAMKGNIPPTLQTKAALLKTQDPALPWGELTGHLWPH